MPVDAELISKESFNKKFKFYLREFYTYQHKEKNELITDGNNGVEDRQVSSSTLYPDLARVHAALTEQAGISWDKDNPSPNSTGKRVACAIADPRSIYENPFFLLYRRCCESSNMAGEYFSLLYSLLFYFHSGSRVQRRNSTPPNNLDLCLKQCSVDAMPNYNAARWDDLHSSTKQSCGASKVNAEIIRYAKSRIKNEDLKDKYSDMLQSIFDYIIINNLKVLYSARNDSFSVQPNGFGFVEKNVLYYAMMQCGYQAGDRQFVNHMKDFCRMGIIRTEKKAKSVYYTLSDIFIGDILGDDEQLLARFTDFISFYSQTQTLGEIGSYILSRMQKSSSNYLRYKHNYIQHALNDYSNIDLLFAIENHLFVYIKYRNASVDDSKIQHILCYPMQLRESVTEGRQYLIYYHPEYRSVSAARVEFINEITLGEMSLTQDQQQDLERAWELLNCTWGTSFADFQTGNVKNPLKTHKLRVIVNCSDLTDIITGRLQRETRGCAAINEISVEGYNCCYEVIADVPEAAEMLQWLRSYITRIILVEIDGKVCDFFNNDTTKTVNSYAAQTPAEHTITPSNKSKSLMKDSKPDGFKNKQGLHGMLFNEIYSAVFTELGRLISDISKSDNAISKRDSNNRLTAYAEQFNSEKFTDISNSDTQDKRLEQSENVIHCFADETPDGYQPVYRLIGEDFTAQELLPLTAVEIQWLQNILEHPLAEGFLTTEDISRLKASLEAAMKKLNQSRLFDVKQMVLYDQYISKDINTPQQLSNLRVILDAIRTNQNLRIKYSKAEQDTICSPVLVEYSKRDNKFRCHTVTPDNIVTTMNLERMLSVACHNSFFSPEKARETLRIKSEENQRSVNISFRQTKNIPDRLLTEFSCFRKSCEKTGENQFTMKLYFDKYDWREIVIRLLSYGSYIFVSADSDEASGGVVTELTTRLNNQYTLCERMISLKEKTVQQEEQGQERE